MSVVVRGGRIVTASADFVGDVLIDGETIAAIGSFPDIDAQVINASGKLVLPGGVDPHTHLDAPLKGTMTADDFESGTIAAAIGGTTSIIDFPVQDKGQDPRVSHEEWAGRAEGKAVVDWGLHQVIVDLPDEYFPALDDLIANGSPSFKMFMAYPGARMVDDATIFKAMRRTADNGGFVLMHCENGPVIDLLEKEALAAGHTGPEYNGVTRPPITESEATARAIALAELAGVPVYVVHLAAAQALAAVADARERGLPVYAETCPHYLLLTEEVLKEPDFGGAKYVMCPPLRTPWHQERLWQGLRTNDLQVVSTDHTPFRFADQKQLGRDNFPKIPNGVPGIEWRTTLLYHFGVREGRIGLNRFVELISTTPAKLFGCYPRKGEIAPGSDADLVIFDPERETTLTAASQATKSDYNPYEGWTVRGVVDTVLLRGQVIVDGGRFVGRKGQGRFLRRGASSALA
ncbi:MAG TPA: dihydropyrimidinase [Actinomycetota bacterium]|nr:dihydropyrimidinase [Actinomycetota bacterium]